jgi:hypothetical protein
MINCESGSEQFVIDQLKSINVDEVRGVLGTYDIVAKIRASSLEVLRDIITQIRKIEHVHATTTIMCQQETDMPNDESSEKDLFRFINSIHGNRHIMLLYDEPEYARKVEFEFIKNGLDKDEHCIYATEEDPGLIILKMINQGIPVVGSIKKNLHVYQTTDPFDDASGPTQGCRNSLKRILADAKPPFRIVGRIVPDVGYVDGISLELELEKDTHANFDKFGGSVMCTYNISEIEKSRRKEWVRTLAESHHNLIYATKQGRSGVFKTGICP